MAPPPPSSCYMIGSESLLIQCAEIWLREGHELRGIVSDDPAIRDWARERGVRALEPAAPLAGALGETPFDYLFSIAHLQMISGEILALPRALPINFHDGPLPRYAGLNATTWALLAGELRHGITWHVMTQTADEGDILVAREFDVPDGETALTLNTRCYEAAIESFEELTRAIGEGRLSRTPQDLGQRSYFARDDRPEAAGLIDWSQSAEEIARLVRAMDTGGYANPVSAAKLQVGSRLLAVGGIEILASRDGSVPGTLLAASEEASWRVATGSEDVQISRLRDIDGPPIEGSLHGLETGSLLAPTPLSRDRVEAAVGGLAAHEPFWTRRLARLQPIALPQAQSPSEQAGAASHAVQMMSFSRTDATAGQPQPDRLIAPIVAHLARVSGRTRFDVAFREPDMAERFTGVVALVSSCVPLRFDLDPAGSATDLAAATDAELARVRRRGSFLRDVVIRFPELRELAASAGPFALPIAIEIVDTLDDPRPAPGAQLTWLLHRNGSDAACVFEESALAAADIAALQKQVLRLARAASADPRQALAKLPLLDDSERQALLIDWNATERETERERCVHELVSEQADRTPGARAVVCGEEAIDYAELVQRANQLAHHLRARGVERETLVGLCLERSVDMVVAMLGIQKAGGAYVPLDPAFPADRIAFMIEDAEMALIVTQESLRWLAARGDVAVVSLDGEREAIAAQNASSPETGSTPGDLAYVIYTSGSTGKPKGVQVEHRNVVNFFSGMDERIPHEPPGTWLAVTSLSFDISVLELSWTLARGFEVVVHSERRNDPNQAAPQRHGDTPIDFSLFYFSSDACADDGASERYRLLLEGARFADHNGFTAVWTPERHFHAFGGLYPNPAVTGAAVAAITENIEIRSGSVVLPLHHPARVAEEWAVVDNLSNGRVAIAVAAGWQPNDFVLRPENHANAKTAMIEGIETVKALWSGAEITFAGPNGDVAVKTMPRPIQQELPVYITTAGNAETFEIAGRNGHNVLTHLLGQTVEQVAEKIAAYRKARREAGHEGDGKVALMLHTFVSRMEDEALRETVRGPMKAYLATAMSLVRDAAFHFPTFQNKQRDSGKSMEEIFSNGFTEEEQDALLDFAFERYYESSGLFGSPEACIARIDELKGIGVSDVACLIDFGVPTEQALDGLKYLAELRQMTAPGAPMIAEESLPALARRHEVSHFQCTPSMASMLLGSEETRDTFADLKHLMLGGEALPVSLVRELSSVSNAQIQNMYGPTETTIWSATAAVDASDGQVHLGRPIANTQLYVVDANLEPLPAGCPGELAIGGDGVVRGYLGRPELTAERFVPDVISGRKGARLYRTGDLVRFDSAGRLEFLGRMDHQIKLRGYRIELGEIESLLEAQPEVREAVVIAREDVPGDERLVAYVVAAAGQAIDGGAQKARLRDALPDYMIPSHVLVLDRLPLTPNAKIDRKALPAPSAFARRAPVEGGGAPVSELQRTLAEIWGRALGVEGVGLDENFFDLGGHSLLVVQVHREIKERLDRPLSITDLFRLPTLRALCEHLCGEGDDGRVAKHSESRAAARRDAMAKRRRRRG